MPRGRLGFTFDSQIPPGKEIAAERLESKAGQIELVSVRQPSDAGPALATRFVPDSAADHFLKKVVGYLSSPKAGYIKRD